MRKIEKREVDSINIKVKMKLNMIIYEKYFLKLRKLGQNES
jgi:hypothetical protein